MQKIISPSILSSDFSRLFEECLLCLDKTQYIHLDVMDNHFVPNLTFGPPVIKCLRKQLNGQAKSFYLDAHLMVSHPESLIPLLENQAHGCTFHYEATDNPKGLIELCKQHNLKTSMALKPATPLSEEIYDIVEELDSVLIMTVNPGFGGQSMMEDCLDKVTVLRKKFPTLDIQVDGGINKSTIAKASKAGANNFVAGSAVFNHPDGVKAAIQELLNLV
eukprot:NODE_2_length_91304_cov_0.692462.p43 type:complete len:219 gc:universal NODE_2_length_91304_cov_0.692462:45504-44848(-)